MLSEETGSVKCVLINHKVKMRPHRMPGSKRTREPRPSASLPLCSEAVPTPRVQAHSRELIVLSEAIQERHSSVITRDHASVSDSSSASATVALERKQARQTQPGDSSPDHRENLILFYKLAQVSCLWFLIPRAVWKWAFPLPLKRGTLVLSGLAQWTERWPAN